MRVLGQLVRDTERCFFPNRVLQVEHGVGAEQPAKCTEYDTAALASARAVHEYNHAGLSPAFVALAFGRYYGSR